MFGLGRIGLVSAAGFATLGHSVIGYELSLERRLSIEAGHAPFVEPGLDGLLQRAITADKLRFARTPEDALWEASIVMVCVGTPAHADGSPDLSQLRQALLQINEVATRRNRPLIVAIRSTAFPGTCDNLAVPIFDYRPSVSLVVNPEFLREGSAVEDFFHPALIVIGGADSDAVTSVAALYSGLPAKPQLTTTRTAEMTKLACNAFHALKVAFANEIGVLAGLHCIDPGRLSEIFVQDQRLNLSAAYLTPGMPFGGACLPKDLQNLTQGAAKTGLSFPLLDSILQSNREHSVRLLDNISSLVGERIGLIGLAFKPGTDDVRQSQLLALFESLIEEGHAIRYYDHLAQTPESLHTHREDSLERLAEWADLLLVGRPLSDDEQAVVAASGKPARDLNELALATQRLRNTTQVAKAG